MIRPEDLKVNDIVRLKCGSPKFIVVAINLDAAQPEAQIFTWSDRQGFVTQIVPIAWLVNPMPKALDQ